VATVDAEGFEFHNEWKSKGVPRSCRLPNWTGRGWSTRLKFENAPSSRPQESLFSKNEMGAQPRENLLSLQRDHLFRSETHSLAHQASVGPPQ
jgi:hypothetical protein